MSKKEIQLFLLSIVSLTLGCMVYVLFRPYSNISIWVNQIIPTKSYADNLRFLDSSFIKYYFVDFLWAFSFSCIIRIVLKEKKKPVIFAVVSFCGLIWELLQCIGTVIGTGDFIDVIMYIMATFVVINI